ncbi:MAG: hypothetical protein COB84_08130 [Rhodobacteraceae bacterium]|nr:MAG: hypothetical protein COB84_08130 [Paracoccaceae bacterium]
MSNVTEKDLLLALLSLDAYHQGYERGIEHDKLQIGAAKRTGISEIRTDSAEYQDGFFAVSYDTEYGEVLSIRGTDFFTGEKARDILKGWVIGAGVVNDNVLHAANFLEQVQTDNEQGSVILTGHSLGGGLAGLMSYLFGNEAIIFDPMPYLLAADEIKKAFEDTPEKIEIYRATSDDLLVNSIADSRLESHQLAVEIYKRSLSPIPDEYFDSNILPLFIYNADGWFLSGEALDSLFGFLGRNNADYPWVQALGLTGKSANRNAGSAVDLHGPGIKVLQLYSDLHGHSEKWLPIHNELYSALFSSAVAANVLPEGKANRNFFREGYGSGTLITTLAYSTIEGTTGLVFGNTGAKALFDDANQLGQLVTADKLSDALTDQVDDLTKVIVQFAGQMALQKVDYTGNALTPEQGILQLSAGGAARETAALTRRCAA